MDADLLIDPIPNASDFRPTTPRARTSVAMDEPVTLRTPSPATHMPTKLLPPSPLIVHGPHDLSTLRSDTPNPWGTLHRHHYSRSPHDFSALCSDSPNLWASLCCCHSQKLHQPICHKPHSFIYESHGFARKWGGRLVMEWVWDWIKHRELPESNRG
jgi:hypothetical protein